MHSKTGRTSECRQDCVSVLAGGHKVRVIFALKRKAQEASRLLHDFFSLMPSIFKLRDLVLWHNEPDNIEWN